MRITYDEIKLKSVIKGVCLKCGKTAIRTIVSNQTVNPFNRHKDGRIKSGQEVYDSVNNDLPLLVKRFKEKFICKKCEDNISWPEKWFDLTEREYIEQIGRKGEKG